MGKFVSRLFIMTYVNLKLRLSNLLFDSIEKAAFGKIFQIVFVIFLVLNNNPKIVTSLDTQL